MSDPRNKDDVCPPLEVHTYEETGTPEIKMMYALDKKMSVVCNKLDNVHEDVNEMRTDIRELRGENREQNKIASSHVPWKYFIIILIAVLGAIGGAYAFAWNGDAAIWDFIRQMHTG